MENMRKETEGLLEFIRKSPSNFHAIENIKNELRAIGCEELDEKKEWKVEPGKGYFVTRNGSSIIGFRIPEGGFKGFHMIASHSDSPTFKVKENPEMISEDKYVRLNTEKYGGAIVHTWLDRPLSVAGRVVVRNSEGKAEVKLVNIDKDLLVIPNCAIHVYRELNKGVELNLQVDTLPLLTLSNAKDGKGYFMRLIADAVGVKVEDILGHDLNLYVRHAGQIVGANDEFMLCPKLDDLQCAYASMRAFCNAAPKEYVSVLAVFDNEESGSTTKQGANSTLLEDVLKRMTESLGMTFSEYAQRVADSFMISADNAHAVHPNHPEKADPTNRPYIGGGLVIKYHGNQAYSTDAVSTAQMKLYCEAAGVPYQTFFNRSDVPSGGTLGNISNTHVSVSSVDIGIPQFGMHSAVETGGTADTWYTIKAFEALYAE